MGQLNLSPAMSRTVDEIVRRVVESASPDRIILFGSAARGAIGPHSDIDLLVIKSGVPHRRKLAQQIHLTMFGIGMPVDIVVATPEDVGDAQNVAGSILATALEEGIQVYAA